MSEALQKLRFDIVPYFHGRVLEMGCDATKAYPHFISGAACGIQDADKLALFASKSLDAIFSPYLLSAMPQEDVVKTLAEWGRVVKQDGYIVLYLPKEGKWKADYETVVAAARQAWKGFDLVDFHERDDGKTLFFAFKLTAARGYVFSHQNPKPEKPCAVVRYGAFGDCIQASSILPWLKEQGYHITFYCSDHGLPVIKHDPHIDRFIVQGRDEVPPEWLADFWKHESAKYDKWINLSESVESTLLASPGHTNYEWPNEMRAKYMNVNYLEFTHDIAQVPPPYQPRFYSTLDERAWARRQAQQFGRRNILWSLSGSSVHKTWPHLDAIIARLMLTYDDVNVVLVGDELSQVLEAGWQQERRVHCRSGKWSIRESMAFAEVADLVIGCETGLLNAAGSMDTAKIVMLSHSSEEMLTKHWRNTIALSQPQGIGCNKQPCRQLHHNWSACMRHESGAAVCQAAIDTEMVWDAVVKVLGVPQRKVA